LALRHRQEAREFVEMARKISRECNVELEKVISAKLPGDPVALRGIPVVGRGIGGASPGTKPEGVIYRLSQDRYSRRH
jgi:hypothetical protein